MNAAEFYKVNVGLVHAVSRKGFARLSSARVTIDYEDVFQEMSVVFLKAFEGFDESKGFKFSTYYYMCAFNRLNGWGQALVEERLKHGVVSIEELGHGNGEDDLELSATMIEYADNSADPEGHYRVKQLLEHIATKLSPLATLILTWSVSPPPEVMTEIRKAQSYAEYGRSLGYASRCMVQLSPRYVANFIRMISDLSQGEVAGALKEIEALRYTDAKRFIGV